MENLSESQKLKILLRWVIDSIDDSNYVINDLKKDKYVSESFIHGCQLTTDSFERRLKSFTETLGINYE